MITESKKLLKSILMELNKSVKAFHIYPATHPSLKTLLEKSFNIVRERLEDFEDSQDAVVISIERNTFYDGKGKELDNEGIADLANEFFHMRIKRLTISKEITPKGWMGLVKLINTEPKEILDAGGAEKFISRQGITDIWINEIKYEDIVSMVTELGKETEGEIENEDKEAPEEKKEESVPIPEVLNEEAFKEEEPVNKDDELDQLLKTLEEERDNIRYREIVKKVVKKAVALKDKKEMDDLVKILYVFSRHSAPDSLRPEEQQDLADMALHNLFDPYTSDILVELLCVEEEEKIKEIGSIILRIGKEIIPCLLDALVERKDIRARRSIYNLIVEFGETAKDDIETRLEDDRWFAVRQMVSLLGMIGAASSFESLKNVLDYPDIKVKKEAVKALAMLKTRKAIQELIDISYSGPPLSIQAIISLGAVKEYAAVPTLIDLVKKKDLWGKNHEVKREAINALGNIGDARAVSALSNILKKRRIFWRSGANTELRSVAALSLGKIGGEQTTKLLQEALESSKGVLYQSCMKALRGLKAIDT